LILIRIVIALLALPMTFIWMLLLPGGYPRGIPMPWGIISYIMLIIVPLLAIGQIFYSELTKLYLLVLLAPVLLWIVVSQVGALLFAFR
jgi:hypothetical protein